MRKLLLIPLLAAIPRLLPAQTSTGQITGTVLDPTGAVVPGAIVRILGAETGDLVRTLRTGETGTFSAPLLRPSSYRLEVEKEGFKKLIREGIGVPVDATVALELTLEPGGTAESVTVTAQSPLLEEKTHTVGQVVDERVIQDLPLNGRNYLELGNLSAGAIPNTRSRDRSFSVYGNRGLQNAFLLDGARNQNYLRGLDNRQRDAMRPSLDAIAEFKVQTSNYSAEYGASAGVIVNVVTKSGTNEIHGSAFEFLRNSAFDARDFFQPAGKPTPLYIQHQFGGSLGLPIRKDRAWWFGAFQRTHIDQGQTYTATVPSLANRQGVFGSPPIFDPATTRPNPSGSGFIRDPFAANLIPASRFDPIGKSIVDRYPAPQFTTSARNYVNNPLDSTRINNATFRGDVRVTDADTMFARFSFDRQNFLRNPVLPPPANTGTLREQPAWSVGYGYTRVFNAAVINEFRFAWNRVAVSQDGTLARDEIIPGSLDPQVDTSIPTFALTGYDTIGAQPPGYGNLPLAKSSGVWDLSDNISVIRGQHTLKAGFDYQLLRIRTFTTLNGRGSFNFTGVFSQNPQARPGTGSPIADLLLGLPNQITIGTTGLSDERGNNFYWYFQDDWAITRRLTLNLGVRYELTRPFTEVANRMANFILEPSDPLFGQLILAGDSRRPRSLLETDKNNIAPRVGFAYRTWIPGLVIRGAYGIFYGQDEGFGVTNRMTNNPPFFGFGGFTRISDQLLPLSTIALSAGLPPRPPPIRPQDFRLDPQATSQLRAWDNRYTLPYIQQWNISLQKELPGGVLAELNYVGNHGLDLWGSYEGNQPLPGPGAVNNRRPLAQYTHASIIRMRPWGSSAYEGISARLEKRFSRGLSFLAAYSFGRSIDTVTNADICDGCGSNDNVQNTRNLRSQRGPSDFNVPNRFVFSGIYQLPFGRGRAFLNSGWLSYLLGGWDTSGIIALQQGTPFTLALSFDNANTGTTSRPDRIRDGRIASPGPDHWYDPAAFVAPPQYTFGNAGRNILTGPGVANMDWALRRDFPVSSREGMRIEFRAEAFNLFNTPHFDNPGATIGTATAGVISSTSQPNRQLQFSLKVVF